MFSNDFNKIFQNIYLRNVFDRLLVSGQYLVWEA